MRKYGFDNFTISLVEGNIDRCMLDSKEKYYISFYKSNNSSYGYNLTDGGSGGSAKKLLDEFKVNEIIDLLKNTSLSASEIGKKYEVSPSCISDINRGKSWTNYEIAYPIRPIQEKKSSIYFYS